MRKRIGAAVVSLAFAVVGGVLVSAAGPPPWAYGFAAPPAPGEAAPPCRDARPISCARPSAPAVEDGILRRLPGTDRTFTVAQIAADYAPADWYPGDHAPMPDIVAHGREKDGVRACGLCHYPNGKGKPENGPATGVTTNYILQQIADFRSGARRSGDPRKANANEMAAIAKSLTDAEAKAAAEYFGSMKWTPWVRVVETDRAPKTRITLNGLFLPLESGEMEPLGQRIVEVPEDPEGTDKLRNPHSGFVAYAPVGSIKKGEVLVTTGGASVVDGRIVPGRTTACATCHGADLLGLGDVPGIAGRSTSYTVRQLYDMQSGARNGPGAQLMKPVVAKLTEEDMIAIAAYLGSRMQSDRPATASR